MKGKVISFINMKGGVGKTTLTINVGHKLSQQDKKVLIVDMDPQFNATQSLLLYKTRQANSLMTEKLNDNDEEVIVREEIKSSEHYKELSKRKETVLQLFEGSSLDRPLSNPSLAQKITNNLYLIPGDLTMAKEISGDTANKVGAVISHFSETGILDDYDYILIDCPPTWSILTHSSLFASDYYIIPSKVDLYSSIGIQLLEEQIHEKITNDKVYKLTGRNLERLGVIFTLVHRSVKAEEDRKKYLIDMFPEIIFLNHDLPHLPSVPTRFVMFQEAIKDSKYSQLNNAIDKITNELISRLKEK